MNQEIKLLRLSRWRRTPNSAPKKGRPFKFSSPVASNLTGGGGKAGWEEETGALETERDRTAAAESSSHLPRSNHQGEMSAIIRQEQTNEEVSAATPG